MSVVPTFLDLLQPFLVAMLSPTFQSFQWLVTGWLFAPRRTITGMMQAAGVVGRKHHSAFHQRVLGGVFSAASWSLDRVGLALFNRLSPWLDEVVFLAVDDTLARKRGLKMFGVGMHHDPLISSRAKAVVNWGRSWVVPGVLVRFPCLSRTLGSDRWFCLPILFRLYLNKQAAVRHHRAYRTRPELAVEMLQLLCKAHKTRRFHVVADSAYGGQNVLSALPANCGLTSRLVLDARLYTLPPARQPGQNGRPRKRGQPLPTPEAMLTGRCRQVELSIYGRRDRVRLASGLACVHAVPNRLLRVVAVEPVSGGRPKQAFYSTDCDARAEQVLTWYAARWSLEVTFHEAKQQLGFEQPQNWSRRAVERTAPVALILYGLIVLWFVREGHRCYQPPHRPWYRTKRHASFADMLATLKAQSVRHQVFSTPLSQRGRRNLLKTLESALSLVI